MGGGHLYVEWLIYLNQLIGCLFPRELPGAQQSVFPLLPIERVFIFETQHCTGYFFRLAGICGMEEVFPVMTGVPQAIASTRGMPKLSRSEG